MSEPFKPAQKGTESPKLPPNAMRAEEFMRRAWAINVPQGVTPEQVLEKEFWAFHAMHLSPYDMIEARWEDGSYWGMYVVCGCDRTWAKVHQLLLAPLTTSDVSLSQSAKFEVKFMGPTKKHCVIRKSDSAIVTEGIALKADAEKWLAENLSVIS